MQKSVFTTVAIIALVAVFGAGYFAGVARGEHEPDMQHTMDTMSAGLDGKSGDDFDRTFLTDMITHHEGAIEMAEAARVNAKHQEIKDLAEAIIQAQTQEIGQMHQWMTAWYGTH